MVDVRHDETWQTTAQMSILYTFFPLVEFVNRNRIKYHFEAPDPNSTSKSRENPENFAFRRQTQFGVRARRQNQKKPRDIYISSADAFRSSSPTLKSKQTPANLHSIGRRFSKCLETRRQLHTYVNK